MKLKAERLCNLLDKRVGISFQVEWFASVSMGKLVLTLPQAQTIYCRK